MKNLSAKLKLFLLVSLLSFTSNSVAENLIMSRATQGFPETMSNLQSAIKNAGYKVSRVQRVDIGLTRSGFKTDKYRVVFFGKAEENAELVKKYPDLIPYLPLKISIFAEENETILVSYNPENMKSFYRDVPPELFNKWSADVRDIINQVQSAE